MPRVLPYKGIYLLPRGKFVAILEIDGAKTSLGFWPTQEGAARARDRAVKFLGSSER